MLSDVTTQLRDRLLPLVSTVDASELFLTLRLMEMEARHMETTIEYLTGRPHVPLEGRLVSSPIIDLQREPHHA
ncbi:hypothetical protein RMR16_008780 [Agrobacterium sp. rho-13.3]|uniref:hypothetical protein n=1 Tax=Agrobacterium sp. rho-13.3 TaxID=3072980 RepID=UPI002A0F5099|nr:hypothetical protein [Agrobacterium sp. rho-13.3]MDX8310045.1 hypothetical protein [Agrobacterium sp. rho-13.3]